MNEEQDKSCPMREKYWDELNDSEKIERMRQLVKNLQNTVKRMSNIIYKLKKHSHNDNQILIPMDINSEYGSESEERSYRNDKYF